MPTVSFDGQSLLIDGRRIWLVSGSIHYARTPHQLWRSRIRAAKQAGLNCIDTHVFWNVHEPRPGRFHFEGDTNLAQFVRLIHEAGMWCILRPGPYVGAGWDFGGLPAWLHRIKDVRLRCANGPFLEACARYLGAVMEQVKDLQVSTPLPGRKVGGAVSAGPIIMVQAENEWFCHNPEEGDGYLRQIARYLRENGCEVPISVSNNLWQRVDGAIDTWNANDHLAADLRQLRVVQPNAPRIVSDFQTGAADFWGGPHRRGLAPEETLHRLAQVLASGAQYNLAPFHGGTNFAFHAGRTTAAPDAFVTTANDPGAPLGEAGGRGLGYHAVRRISTFASQFAQLFAHLEPARPHAAILPEDAGDGLSVIHQRGSQGEVVFLLRDKNNTTELAHVLLPNGLTLPVPIGESRTAWFVLHANLGGVAELSYTNLRPWAFVDKKMLVLFGPAGGAGQVAINDTPWNVAVPTGQTPLVEQHEEITVVVLNHEQLDAAYLTPAGLVIGANGLDDHDQPIPLEGWPNITTVTHAGEVRRAATKSNKPPAAPRLGRWQRATVTDMLDGLSNQFKAISGPASLESLGCDFGYGWYKLEIVSPRAANILAPKGGDRLHVYNKGSLEAILGRGPGATFDPVNLRLGGDTVVLADNLGRFSFGWRTGEQTGLFGHLYAVDPLRLGKPEIVEERVPDPFELGGCFVYLRKGDRSVADSLVWKLQAPARSPLILDIDEMEHRAMLLVNGKGVGLYDKTLSAGRQRFVLEHGRELRKGRNEIRLAFFQKHADAAEQVKFLRLYEATANLTEKAKWSFAPWTPPGSKSFTPAPQSSGRQPCWYRCQFQVSGTAEPLWLEPNGMTKGQIYINGHNAGRYFVATPDGKTVEPQTRYYLPEPWLKADAPNELMLFDEHGKSPAKCRLVYEK